MKIKKVKRYSTAKYPSEKYKKKEYNKLLYVFLAGGNSLLMLSLLQGCDKDGGLIGYMIEPDAISESQAREIVFDTFERHLISLSPDYEMRIPLEDNDPNTVDTDSVTIHLDGYNPDLKIGFEYIGNYDENDEEAMEFYRDERTQNYFIKSMEESEKSVKLFLDYCDHNNGAQRLGEDVDAFIDSLRAQGII